MGGAVARSVNADDAKADAPRPETSAQVGVGPDNGLSPSDGRGAYRRCGLRSDAVERVPATMKKRSVCMTDTHGNSSQYDAPRCDTRTTRRSRASGRIVYLGKVMAMTVGAGVLMVLVTGCVRRIPEPVGGHTEAPHVGWVIMSGDAANPDRDFICQSNPRSECLIPADRPERRVMGDVHVYFHAAAEATKYTGSVRVGFFDQPHDITLTPLVRPGVAGTHSVTDFVSKTPGAYTFVIDVVATAAQTGVTQTIREQVEVVVQ